MCLPTVSFGQYLFETFSAKLSSKMNEKDYQGAWQMLDPSFEDMQALKNEYIEEKGQTISLFSWLDHRRLELLSQYDFPSKSGEVAKYQSHLEENILDFEDYSLWSEDPSEALKRAQQRWKDTYHRRYEASSDPFDSEEDYILYKQKRWEGKIKDLMVSVEENPYFDLVGKPEELVRYYNGLGDLFYSKQKDCRLSMSFWEKSLENLSQISKENAKILDDDFGWGEKGTQLKLFHCYKETGQEDQAQSVLKKLKRLGVYELYIPREFRDVLKTFESLNEAVLNPNAELVQINTAECGLSPQIVSKEASEGLKFKEGKFCRQDINDLEVCYTVSDGSFIASAPFILGNKVFLLVRRGEGYWVDVFNKDTGLVLKTIPTHISIDPQKLAPLAFSTLNGKLYIHNPYFIAQIDPYLLQLDFRSEPEFVDLKTANLLQTDFEKQDLINKDIFYRRDLFRYYVDAAFGPTGRNASSLIIQDIFKGMEKSKKKGLLDQFLQDPDPHVQVYAAAQRPYDNTPQLISLSSDPDWKIRWQAVKALKELGGMAGNDEVVRFIELLSDEEPYIREMSIEALGGLNLGLFGKYAQDAIPNMTKLLSDPQTNTREKAAEALGNQKGRAKQAVPELTKLLVTTEAETVRWQAAHALGKIGKDAQSAIPELKKLLLENNSTMSNVAEEAINKIQKDLETP